jgi:hypothetical protein
LSINGREEAEIFFMAQDVKITCETVKIEQEVQVDKRQNNFIKTKTS